MKLSIALAAGSALSLMVSACAVTPSSGPDTGTTTNPDEARADFDQGFNGLQEDFHKEGKADIFGIEPCDYLAPLFQDGHNYTHAGFFAGVEGDGVVGLAKGMSGYDMVWDMYHHQMSVSHYSGAGIASPGLSGSLSFYAGFATGFEHGVSNWDGYFVTADMDIGLPFLKDYLSMSPGIFVSGVDRNNDGVIAPSEMLVPPEGVYGFQLSLSVGFDLMPTPSPIEGSIAEGYWEPYKKGIRYYYDKFRETHFVKLGSPLNVHLVDHETGEECDADWPNVDPDRDCVIQFGEEDWSHAHRGLHVAYSICTALGGCEIPLSWPMSVTAIAIGAYRDVGDSVNQMCPSGLPPVHHHPH